jgi:hypothetical protein
VVTVPDFLPKLLVITMLVPDEAPAVVTLLRANRTFARSLPLTTRSI